MIFDLRHHRLYVWAYASVLSWCFVYHSSSQHRQKVVKLLRLYRVTVHDAVSWWLWLKNFAAHFFFVIHFHVFRNVTLLHGLVLMSLFFWLPCCVQICSTSPPAETRLTVYRRPEVTRRARCFSSKSNTAAVGTSWPRAVIATIDTFGHFEQNFDECLCWTLSDRFDFSSLYFNS